jgi:hypothetical protein
MTGTCVIKTCPSASRSWLQPKIPSENHDVLFPDAAERVDVFGFYLIIIHLIHRGIAASQDDGYVDATEFCSGL